MATQKPDMVNSADGTPKRKKLLKQGMVMVVACAGLGGTPATPV